MFLPLPDILRFKGSHAQKYCDLWETALQGRCEREGNTLMLDGEIKVSVDLSTGSEVSGQRSEVRGNSAEQPHRGRPPGSNNDIGALAEPGRFTTEHTHKTPIREGA
jgi:hypothetical protein